MKIATTIHIDPKTGLMQPSNHAEAVHIIQQIGVGIAKISDQYQAMINQLDVVIECRSEVGIDASSIDQIYEIRRFLYGLHRTTLTKGQLAEDAEVA